MKLSTQTLWRPSGVAVIASLALPTLLAGCGSPAPTAQAPVPRMQQSRPANAGMSTRQKGTLLVGAAAMYYLYRKYQRDNAAKFASAPGGKVQFYRSKKGGYIYYRDPQTKQAIKVPGTENGVEGVQQQQFNGNDSYDYSKFQGYNGAQQGETLDRYFPVQ